jgi:hypothetical protein
LAAERLVSAAKILGAATSRLTSSKEKEEGRKLDSFMVVGLK